MMKKHPNLHKKLHALYTLRVNPEIRSNVDLARYLGVSRQAVSRWCQGTATTQGDSIPDYQLVPFANAFGIDPYWLCVDLEEFETAIKSKLVAEKSGPVVNEQQISTATLPITDLNILGRKSELSSLNHFWQNPRTFLVQITGFGGVGKSALVNKWLSDLSAENYRYATRVYAWSFHWQGHSSDMKSSGDFFIEHALQWFGDENPSVGTPWAKAVRLAKLIRSYRTILILDGLEPLQYPPGNRAGEIENPAVALLIRELASEINGLCIVTSRLSITDLERFQDGRVETCNLGNLKDDEGVQLLRNLGIKGSRRVCTQAVNSYSGHPLSLSLLAGYLTVVHGGDVREFRQLRSLLDERRHTDDVIGLMQVYLDWIKGNEAAEILFIVSLFDRAVNLKDVRQFAATANIPLLTEQSRDFGHEDWRYCIAFLKEANLISAYIVDGDLVLDCHPIVRDFVANHLENTAYDDWVNSHSVIFEMLQRSADSDPESMQELEPLFRAVIHGAQACRYEEAFGLYFEKIKKRQFSISTEASHHADHTCLRAFFEREWDTPCSKLPEESQVYLLSSAATNLIYLGHIEEALGPSMRSICWFKEHGMLAEAASAAAPLVSMLIATGELDQAITLMVDMEEAIELTGNKLIQAVANNFKGYAYYLMGDNDLARDHFQMSEEVITRLTPLSCENYGTISSYYCKFLLETESPQLALDRSLKTFAWRKRKSWQVNIDTTSMLGSDLLVLGLIFTQLGDYINARKYLNKQVDLFRSADEWLYLPTGLNSRAKFLMKVGEFDAALSDLEESLEISAKTGASLGQWEALIERAHLEDMKGNRENAIGFLDRAEEMPGMSSYKFRANEIGELRQRLS
jgi:tetratricopeptide (TPR) repeat protein/transcriptional regulator with XRE-family HTH domain